MALSNSDSYSFTESVSDPERPKPYSIYLNITLTNYNVQPISYIHTFTYINSFSDASCNGATESA
jgi:hypothetical protein